MPAIGALDQTTERDLIGDWIADGAPLDQPVATNLAITTKDNTSATLRASIDPNVHANTTVPGTARFDYGTAPNPGTPTTLISGLTGTNGLTQTASISNLSCGTVYYYRARATNGDRPSGNPVIASDSTFVTDACSAPVINVNGSPNNGPLNFNLSKGQSLTNADLLLSATDVDYTTTLDWNISSAPGAGNGTATVTSGTNTANPGITYTAPATVPTPATISFTVRVADETVKNDTNTPPGANTTGPLTDTITINVTIVDNAPTVDMPTSMPAYDFVVAEDSTNNPLTITASDLDMDTLTWSTQVLPSATYSGAENGSVNTQFDVLYTPTPQADTNNADTFTVRVSDGAGFDEIVVSVDITPSPDDPVANDDPNIIVDINTPNTIDVLANDTDVDTVDTKTLAAQTIVGSLGGTITINNAGTPNNTLDYTTALNSVAVETFTYTVTDSFGRTDTALVTVTPRDSDADGVADFLDNCAGTANGPAEDNQADNDGDQIINVNTTTDPADPLVGGDACDTDDDNDGMLDADEAMFPSCLDPFVDDAAGDCDGDGIDNITEVNDGDPNTRPDQDSVAPSVTAPAGITVDATGFLTIVDLGKPVATDGNDGTITLIVPVVDAVIADSPADNADCLALSNHPVPAAPFRPGSYTVNWYTCDTAGNLSAPSPQTVNVRPIATTTTGQVIGEGQTATVEVMLNGTAPAYPVTLGYAIGGSATNPEDHDATNGTIAIASGTAGSFTINIAADIVVETQEQLDVVFTSATNAVLGAQTRHSISIVENNIAPEVEIGTNQNGIDTGATIYADGGTVILTADDFDANGDVLAYLWSDASNAIAGIATGGITSRTLTFDPLSLTAGVYPVSVSVNDGTAVTAATVNLVVIPNDPSPTLTAIDSDGDMVNDNIEGAGDSDGDGIPNYLDDSSLPESVLQNQTNAPSTSLLLETEAGLTITMGRTARAAGVNAGQLSQGDIDNNGGQAGGIAVNAADSYTNISGFYDFEISGLNASKDIADVVIPLPVAILPGSEYRKYKATAGGGGWSSFVVDDLNKIKSAPGSLGVCPAPGSVQYKDGLAPFDLCVQLTLQDGGPNDADGVRDFIIRDPGGVATPPVVEAVTPTGSDRIGVLHPLLLALFSLISVMLYRHRRR